MKTASDFVIALVFRGWGKVEGVISILLGIVALLLASTHEMEVRIISIVLVAVVVFFLKIIRQLYTYYQSFLKPIKVIRKIQGDGLYKGKSIIVLENPGYLRDNVWLTLFSKSAGASQSICILRIIKSVKGEDLLAVQSAPEEHIYDINKYFDEDVRRESLYAIPLVNEEELRKCYSISSGG